MICSNVWGWCGFLAQTVSPQQNSAVGLVVLQINTEAIALVGVNHLCSHSWAALPTAYMISRHELILNPSINPTIKKTKRTV